MVQLLTAWTALLRDYSSVPGTHLKWLINLKWLTPAPGDRTDFQRHLHTHSHNHKTDKAHTHHLKTRL